MTSDIIWNPRAYQLRLHDVPMEYRAEVRMFLAPLLRDQIEVRPGRCWDVARLVLHLNNTRCNYVEGVWLPAEDIESPALGLHAWMEIDSHRVDLIAEFFRYQRDRARLRPRRYLYETIRRFSPAVLKDLPLGSCLAIYSLYVGREEIPGLPEHLKNRPIPGAGNFKQVAEEFHTFIENSLFRDALNRLIERQKKDG
jgi:hypothetical protein